MLCFQLPIRLTLTPLVRHRKTYCVMSHQPVTHGLPGGRTTFVADSAYRISCCVRTNRQSVDDSALVYRPTRQDGPKCPQWTIYLTDDSVPPLHRQQTVDTDKDIICMCPTLDSFSQRQRAVAVRPLTWRRLCEQAAPRQAVGG